jgi:hypothetical protein
VADVSAVADPNTGVAVYDSLPSPDGSGWMVFGGTSAAAPLVAAFDALLGPSAASPQYPYQNAASYFDVTAGSDGSCAWTYLCTSGLGYDGPTGLGSPNGSPGTTASGGGAGGSGSNPPGSGTSPAPSSSNPPAPGGGGSVPTPEPPVATPQPAGGAEAPLRLSVSTAARRLTAALARGLRITVSCSRACRVNGTLSLAPSLARRLRLHGATVTLAHASGSGDRVTLSLRFSAGARRLLSRQQALRLVLRVTAQPGSGAARTASRPLLLRR